MANVEFCRQIPETIRPSGGLWLPELNVRLWRATYGAFLTTHNPGAIGTVTRDTTTAYTTLATVPFVFPDDWGLDLTLAAGLKVEVGIYMTIFGTGGNATGTVRINGGSNTVAGPNDASPTDGYIKKEWTTLPTDSTDVVVEYQVTGSFGVSEDITIQRKDNDAADVYVAFLES